MSAVTGERQAGKQVVFRPRRAAWISGACAAVIVAVFTVVAVLLRESNTGVVFRTSDQVAMVVLGLLIAGGIMLWASPRVVADAEGVEVRNVLVKRRFAWSDVLAISFPDGASFARLELPYDEYYAMLAIQAVDREHAVHAVRTLRKLHRAARSAKGE
ncbi:MULTISPECIES: PH domain-containing protein [Thermocrispum]|uniref:PH domain-containing protein n=1 Tax=Thermocrispum agreste TaxID=37925 RepID=A0ABD6FCQ3_9PSEU|nr:MULTISPECIES: PH domain-containing protein [Thermocrispum]